MIPEQILLRVEVSKMLITLRVAGSRHRLSTAFYVIILMGTRAAGWNSLLLCNADCKRERDLHLQCITLFRQGALRFDPKFLKVRMWVARQQDTGKLEASLGALRCELINGAALDWLSEFLVITGFSGIQILDGAVQSPAALAESLLQNAPSTLCRL